ncbi:flagellar biosynthetic protein FliO [Dyella sp.]|uniref:FliO/MopB family protein n=1 Tax=Dyella sp. TaxID=1869338 RepID=UPI002ED536BF
MKKLLRNLPWIAMLPAPAFAAESTENGSLWLGLLVPLFAVTAALLAMLWWLRRGQALRGGTGPIKLVQAVAVGAKERVVVLDAQGRRLVIGVTSSHIELIAELRNDDAS